MTGLWSAASLQAAWPELAQRARHGHPMAVIVIDSAEALEDNRVQQLAAMITVCCSGGELVFHTAAQRFTVLVPDVRSARLSTLTSRLRNEIADGWGDARRPRIGVTIIGRMSAPTAATRPDSAPPRSHTRLRAARAGRRDRAVS